MDIRRALKGQYHAALGMLRQAIELCPEELWNGGPHPVPFWQVAYHTLHATDMYLQPTLEDFRRWEHHREGYDDLPWPVDSGAKFDDPYTRAQILEYWRLCDDSADAAVDRLDLDAADCGFPWHKGMPKLEHQLHNIRHIQHHAALLAGRLRAACGTDVRWVRSNGWMYTP